MTTANRFIFVQLSYGLPSWDITGNPVTGIAYDEKANVFRDLAKRMDKSAACELVASIEASVILHSHNTCRDLHAEENLFVNYWEKKVPGLPFHKLNSDMTLDIDVSAMLISLEPCYDKRYAGHGCIDLFKAGGRDFKSKEGGPKIHGLFKPLMPETFVFFLQAQSAKGEKGAEWQGLKLNEMQEFMEAMQNLVGPPAGVEMTKLGKLKAGETLNDKKVVTTGKERSHQVDTNNINKTY